MKNQHDSDFNLDTRTRNDEKKGCITLLKFFKNFDFIKFVIILVAFTVTVLFVFNMVGVVAGIISVIAALGIMIKYGFSKKTQESAMRVAIYLITAQFFLNFSFNLLPNIELAILWILTTVVSIFLVIFSLINRDNIINWCYTLKNSILVALCFGFLPVVLSFSSFFILDTDFIYARYFRKGVEIQQMFQETNFLDYLDNLDSNIFNTEDRRTFSISVLNNENIFISFLYENEQIMHILNEHGLNPLDIHEYFSTFVYVYNKFDLNFWIFGYSTGFLLFCLYHNYINKTRNPLLFFGIVIAIIMFLSTFSDGAILYWFLNNATSATFSVEEIQTIDELFRGLSIVFGVFIAIDRVYKNKESTPLKTGN